MKTKLKAVKIKVGKNANLQTAEAAGLDWLGADRDEMSTMSWYDRSAHTGGPREVCEGESLKCATAYATAHGAQYHIATERYDLFYAPVPDGTATLEPEMVREVHRGLERDRFENQQGG